MGGWLSSQPVMQLLLIEGKLRKTVQKELCVRDQIEDLREIAVLWKKTTSSGLKISIGSLIPESKNVGCLSGGTSGFIVR